MARVELVYPKIPGSAKAPLENCIAFEKYDDIQKGDLIECFDVVEVARKLES